MPQMSQMSQMYQMSQMDEFTQSIFCPIKPSYASKIQPDLTKPIAYFPIMIKSMTGKYTTISIHDKMTIEEIKMELEKIDKIPIHQQRLVYNGKELQDTQCVESYNLKINDMIHIVLRLRGGMFHETSSRKDHTSLKNDTCILVDSSTSVSATSLNVIIVNEPSLSEKENEIKRLEMMIRLHKYGLLPRNSYFASNVASNVKEVSSDSENFESLLWLKPKDYLPSP